MKVLLVGGEMHGESVYTNKTYLENNYYLMVGKIPTLKEISKEVTPTASELEEYLEEYKYKIIKRLDRRGNVLYYGRSEGILDGDEMYKELVIAERNKAG